MGNYVWREKRGNCYQISPQTLYGKVKNQNKDSHTFFSSYFAVGGTQNWGKIFVEYVQKWGSEYLLELVSKINIFLAQICFDL